MSGAADSNHVQQLCEIFPLCTPLQADRILQKFNNSLERSLEWMMTNDGSYEIAESSEMAVVPYGPTLAPDNLPPLLELDGQTGASGPSDGAAGGHRSSPVEVVDLTGGVSGPGKRQREEDELEQALHISKSQVHEDEDANIRKAMAESLASHNSATEETAMMLYKMASGPVSSNPYDNAQIEGMPAGLVNCGNTCYFNALVQIFFSLIDLRNCVLSVDPTVIDAINAGGETSSRGGQQARFLHELQRLFAFMVHTRRRFIDPSGLLGAIIGNTGQPIAIGDQQDVIEFNDVFIKRAEEAFEKVKVDDANPIKQLFYGRTRVTVLCPETADESHSESTMTEEFLHIIAPVEECRTVYDSLDQFTAASDIEDFETPSGRRVRARREVWIESAPPVLMIQLQRARYNAQLGVTEKLNTPLEYCKTLFMERYMADQKERTREIRARIDVLRQRRARLSNLLQSHANFQGSGVAIDAILRMSASYIAGAGEKGEDGGLYGACVELSSQASQYSQLPPSEAHTETTRELLITHADLCETCMSNLRSDIANVDVEISHMFDGMCNLPYELRGVLVHDGQAGVGHYWAYICDDSQTWRKFNDTNVSVVSEQDVYLESVGGHRNASAYCLVYVDRQREGGLRQIADALVAVVDADNQKLLDELATWDAAHAPVPLSQQSTASGDAVHVPAETSCDASAVPMEVQYADYNNEVAGESSPPPLFADGPMAPPDGAVQPQSVHAHVPLDTPMTVAPTARRPSKHSASNVLPLVVSVRIVINEGEWPTAYRRDVARYSRLFNDVSPASILGGLPLYLHAATKESSASPLFQRAIVEGLVVRVTGRGISHLNDIEQANLSIVCKSVGVCLEIPCPPAFRAMMRAFRVCQKAALHFALAVEAVDKESGSYVQFCHAFHAARYNMQLVLNQQPSLPMAVFSAALGEAIKAYLGDAFRALNDGHAGGDGAGLRESLQTATAAVRALRLFASPTNSPVGRILDGSQLNSIQTEWMELAENLQTNEGLCASVPALVTALVADPEDVVSGVDTPYAPDALGRAFSRRAKDLGIATLVEKETVQMLESADPEYVATLFRSASAAFKERPVMSVA